MSTRHQPVSGDEPVTFKSAQTLDQFRYLRSAAGRPKCYAREQLRYAPIRIFLIILGSATFYTFANERVAAFSLMLALCVELVEDAYLLWMRRQEDAFIRSRANFVMICLVGLAQSAGLSYATWMTWLITLEFLPDVMMVLFLSAIAAGASYVISHMFWPAILRMVPPAIATFHIFYFEFRFLQDYQIAEHAIFGVASLIIVMLTIMLVSAVYRSMRDREEIRYELLKSRESLAESYKDLQDQAGRLRQLAMIAHHAADPVLVIDPQGLITWVNPAFERRFGFSQEEAMGNRINTLLAGPETDPSSIDRASSAIAEGVARRVEIANYTKDGLKVWNEASLNPVFSDDGKVEHFVSILRDIEGYKRRQSRLVEARFQAEAAARNRASFLANMSHEIRTPMNGILGMTDLLMQSELSTSQRSYAAAIEGSGRSLLTIINDILDLSKLEAGALDISPVPTDPRVTLQNVIDLLHPQADGKSVELSWEVAASVPDLISVDETRLRQILLNLVGNAIKFTDEGQVSISVFAEDSTLVLLVEDTGIGIPYDRQERIFDQFAQVDSEHQRGVRGTGLGLAISRLLARLMGGDVTVYSEPGKGSTFRVAVSFEPASLAEAEPESDRGLEDLMAFLRTKLAGQPVLIAEDNSLNATLLENYLEKLGVKPLVAADGKTAVELFTEHRPILIFMDVNMPVMNGLDACRAIRAMEGDQPCILALTASAFDSDRDACLDAGMDAFLSKPLLSEELYRKLENIFDRCIVPQPS